jgi:CheY-like chemotaxis protein
MDGYEVARRIRKIPGLGSVVLVALTGHAGEADRRRSLAAGFDFHLVKPAEPRQVLAAVAGRPDPDVPSACCAAQTEGA